MFFSTDLPKFLVHKPGMSKFPRIFKLFLRLREVKLIGNTSMYSPVKCANQINVEISTVILKYGFERLQRGFKKYPVKYRV